MNKYNNNKNEITLGEILQEIKRLIPEKLYNELINEIDCLIDDLLKLSDYYICCNCYSLVKKGEYCKKCFD